MPVTLETYLRRRAAERAALRPTRATCWTCRQIAEFCFCGQVRPFATAAHFVILIHPIEVKRRIATGRMAHLCLENSTLVQGEDFSDHAGVHAIVADPGNRCVMLYPGRDAINLSRPTAAQRRSLTAPDRRLVIFVIDGTWNTAGSMMRSRMLRDLPTISFDPAGPSTFRVRKQPKPECLSTVEAVHRTISLLPGEATAGAHDNLLRVFDHMVEAQLEFLADRRRRGELRPRY